MKTMVLKKSIVLAAAIILAVSTVACSQKTGSGNPSSSSASGNHPVIEIVMADDSKMTFELYPEYAPETVSNFIRLAKSGFYDGLKFHRIISGFMIQGGDPKGTGMGGSDKNIKGEFSSNGFKQNTLKHTKGVLSMARSGNPNSASSQFFIVHGQAPHLDGDYAAFGKMIKGEKILDELAATPVGMDPNSGKLTLPKKDVVMKKVNVLSE
jgi:peptidylprolyl isomerase/peptidyl-prolyl cis-trans isomerase B (cyclophilin B)